MLDNLDETIDLIPPVPVAELDIHHLDAVEPGTYQLEQPPTPAFLKSLPNFANGEHEVGIFCIKGKWLITLSDSLNATPPDSLASIGGDGAFQLDMHTHPGSDPGSEQPSNDDIMKLKSTFDGYNYIINEKGLVEFHVPEEMPGRFTELFDLHASWTHWITNDLKLTAEQFHARGGWELKKEYFEKFFGLKTIPWEDDAEIQRVLHRGDVDIDTAPPFPG